MDQPINKSADVSKSGNEPTATTTTTTTTYQPPLPPAVQPIEPFVHFSAVQSHPPAAYFAIVGETFATYCNVTQVNLGRSHTPAGRVILPADPAAKSATLTDSQCVSLGNSKCISRSHLTIRWLPELGRWLMIVTGKNGFWFGEQKIQPATGTPPTPGAEEAKAALADAAAGTYTHGFVVLSSSRASQFRIGIGEDSCIFYFVPAIDPPQKRKPKTTPTKKNETGEGGGANATNATGATSTTSGVKKKRKSTGTDGNAESQPLGPDGKPIEKKKRKKNTIIPVPAMAGSTSAPAAGPSPIDLTLNSPAPTQLSSLSSDSMPLATLLPTHTMAAV